jgi:hypothetical protein
MNKIQLLAFSLFAFLPISTAFATDPINMIGTWVGVANVAVLGANTHHNTTDPQEVRFARTEFTFIIDKQQGQNFSGYRFSKNGGHDNFVGALRSDMKSGVMTDSDGHRSFQMVSKDLMDSCYTHTISSNGKSTVAECNELKRQ